MSKADFTYDPNAYKHQQLQRIKLQKLASDQEANATLASSPRQNSYKTNRSTRPHHKTKLELEISSGEVGHNLEGGYTAKAEKDNSPQTTPTALTSDWEFQSKLQELEAKKASLKERINTALNFFLDPEDFFDEENYQAEITAKRKKSQLQERLLKDSLNSNAHTSADKDQLAPLAENFLFASITSSQNPSQLNSTLQVKAKSEVNQQLNKRLVNEDSIHLNQALSFSNRVREITESGVDESGVTGSEVAGSKLTDSECNPGVKENVNNHGHNYGKNHLFTSGSLLHNHTPPVKGLEIKSLKAITTTNDESVGKSSLLAYKQRVGKLREVLNTISEQKQQLLEEQRSSAIDSWRSSQIFAENNLPALTSFKGKIKSSKGRASKNIPGKSGQAKVYSKTTIQRKSSPQLPQSTQSPQPALKPTETNTNKRTRVILGYNQSLLHSPLTQSSAHKPSESQLSTFSQHNPPTKQNLQSEESKHATETSGFVEILYRRVRVLGIGGLVADHYSGNKTRLSAQYMLLPIMGDGVYLTEEVLLELLEAGEFRKIEELFK